jgi:hypothetical protein
MKVFGTAEMSSVIGIIEVPSNLKPSGITDYLETKTMYKKFWTKCQECFVFKVDTKYSISIDQMERAPKDWTICEYKEHKMNETLHYLLHMLDVFVK